MTCDWLLDTATVLPKSPSRRLKTFPKPMYVVVHFFNIGHVGVCQVSPLQSYCFSLWNYVSLLSPGGTTVGGGVGWGRDAVLVLSKFIVWLERQTSNQAISKSLERSEHPALTW